MQPEVMRMASQITSLSADVTALKNQAASCQARFGGSVLHDRTSYGGSQATQYHSEGKGAQTAARCCRCPSGR